MRLASEHEFTTENIEQNNQYANGDIGTMLQIVDEQGQIILGPIYNNQKYYTLHEPFASAGVRRAGGATLSEGRYPVRLSDNRAGVLEITMVMANS